MPNSNEKFKKIKHLMKVINFDDIKKENIIRICRKFPIIHIQY